MDRTPLLNISEKLSCCGTNNIYLKFESLNLSGSIKDRIVKYILDDGFKNNKINKGTTVICASSGNTGISVAMHCALYQLKCIIITNPKCSDEKKNIMKAYGAELRIKESNYEAEENVIAKSLKNSFSINQYDNLLNKEAYVKTLGPELKSQLDKIDYIVATASTGGTITGLSEYFKNVLKSDTKMVLADPYGSQLFNLKNKTNIKDNYKTIIEGAGKNKETKVMNLELVDITYKISDKNSLDMCRKVAKLGYLLGGSSGLNIYTATKLIDDLGLIDKNIVVICPDAGYRYLSKIYC